MDIKKLLEQAKKEGRTALTEAEAKRVLNLYGVPVVSESVAVTPEEAGKQAETFGFPVVLKGLGTKLTHKTERGLVHLNLKRPPGGDSRGAGHRPIGGQRSRGLPCITHD